MKQITITKTKNLKGLKMTNSKLQELKLKNTFYRDKNEKMLNYRD